MPTAKHKLSLPDPEPDLFWRRFLGVVLGVTMLGFMGWVWYDMPDGCRWLVYITTPVFTLGSCWLIFVSVRGRAEDLEALSAKSTADTAATSAVSSVVSKIIDNIEL